MIERHGSERVVLASDWLMADPAADIAAFKRLGLPYEQLAGVLGGNLSRLLARD